MSVCWTPATIGYASRKEARQRARQIQQTGGRRQHAYECRCGLWHLTCMSARDARALTRRKRAA